MNVAPFSELGSLDVWIRYKAVVVDEVNPDRYVWNRIIQSGVCLPSPP